MDGKVCFIAHSQETGGCAQRKPIDSEAGSTDSGRYLLPKGRRGEGEKGRRG